MAAQKKKRKKSHSPVRIASEQEQAQLLEIFNQSDVQTAEKAVHEFIKQYPNDSYGYKVLAAVLEKQGRLEEALTAAKNSVRLAPGDSRAYANVASFLMQTGKEDEGEQYYRKAIELDPKNYQALTYLGGILRQKKQHLEAESLLRSAIKINPQYATAYVNLGGVLYDMGHLIEAEQQTRKALELDPESFPALLTIVSVLLALGREPKALTFAERALALQPDNLTALLNLALVHKDLKQYESAIEVLDKLLIQQPDHATALFQLANCYGLSGQYETASDIFEKTIALKPDYMPFRIYYVLVALPIVSPDLQEERRSLNAFMQRVNDLSDWLQQQGRHQLQFDNDLGSLYPFYLAYRGGNHLKVLSQFGDILGTPFQVDKQAFKFTPSKQGKIRLLIICAYIRRHSVWDIILKGLIKHLDRSRFELLIYHFGKVSDGETSWAKSQADCWRDHTTNANSTATWLQLIKEAQPEVIFYPEIGMSPTAVFLASQRLAPLQIVGWGHPITSGLPDLDLYCSGELLEPEDADSHYREKLIRLPGTGCCTEPLNVELLHSDKIELFLQRLTRPVFVIPQMPFKFALEDDSIFADIAAKMGRCTFLFPEPDVQQWGFDLVFSRIKNKFIEKGLNPDSYVKTFPWFNQGRFLKFLESCDVFLDCPNFSGYTTAWQALHCGLPIVTLEGESMRQRLASGLLRQIDRTETIAHNKQKYIDLAVQLAQESLDKSKYQQRRNDLKTAVAQADNRIEVIRAFEQTLIDELKVRNALPNAFSELNTTQPVTNQEHKQTMTSVEPPLTFPWQKLNKDLHLESLSHDYAPVGLLSLIAQPPEKVLDVGCFCGGSGRWLKNRFPDVRVTGIEMLAKAAAMAQSFYDEVQVGRFEDIDKSAWQGQFDAIITADVLEHMYNPWEVLLQLKPLLKPTGAIYISLPNIRNLTILMDLAQGKWPYAEAGILDITHIRFFTKTQALEMLQQTGWQVTHLTMNPDSRVTPHFQNKNLDSIDTIAAGQLKLENMTKEDVLELMALQFYIRAIPVA